ncbi:MAG TPA: hypothetical protein VK116_15175, partial [Planctomycetota bacterium]|nr:hypothetical protein [Planctomycetota bacterium]
MSASAVSCAIALVLALLSASDTLRAEDSDWPEFRGPTGQGTSSATTLPLEWGPDRNVAWKVAVPG